MTGTSKQWQVQAKLLVSIRYGELEDCKKLLLSGADPDQTFKTNNQVKPAILIAVELCSIDFVKLLVKHGCSLDRRDSSGRTALHVAIEVGSGCEEIAEFLLSRNADANLPDSCGQTPLHLAVKRGLIGIVRLLIERGADVTRQNSNGNTPLSYISYASTSAFAITKLLIDNGACVDETDIRGNSILSQILESGNYTYETVKLLVQHGSRLNFMGPCGRAPIHLVIFGSNESKWRCLDLMLKFGCDVDLETRERQTPLHIAVKMQDLKSIQILVRAGANPNTVDYLGVSPLSHALAFRGGGISECSIARIRKLVFTLINGGARMTLKEFDTTELPYFTEYEAQLLRQRFRNPERLVELCRKSVWKLLSPNTLDWLNEHPNMIPSILIPFIQFSSSG